MAKKKKTALKPTINRGFATTSTPSKRPDKPNGSSNPSTGDTNTPSEDTKRELALAYDQLEISDTLGQQIDEDHVEGNTDEFDAEKEEEQALQNLVKRLQEKVDKEVSRVWKNIEFDQRQSKQLPIFEMEAGLREEIVELSRQESKMMTTDKNIPEEGKLSALLAEISPSSAANDMLQKALISHALLLRLGFTFQQALSALSSCNSVSDLDDCMAWLACNLTSEELDAAERKSEGKPPLKAKRNGQASHQREDTGDTFDDPVDTSVPPQHEGFTFDRQRKGRLSLNQNGGVSSASTTTSTVVTPLELSPEIELAIKDTLDSAKSMLQSLEDREMCDALERPIEAYARARLCIIQLEKLTSKLDKCSKGIKEGSSPLLDESRRKLLNVKAQARVIIDESRESRDWNAALADRQFLKMKAEWEESQEPEVIEAPQAYPGHETSIKVTGINGNTNQTNGNGKGDTTDEVNKDNNDTDSDEDGGMFGDMLDEQANEITDVSSQTIVRLRELPPQTIKAAGSKSPKVLLSDALRRVDPYATSQFDAISTGGKMYRSRLTLRWSTSKTEIFIDTYIMTGMATSTQSSADDVLAVAALMCIEERPVYKMLASGWRDWWTELEEKRQEEKDRRSRMIYKKLLQTLHSRLIEENIKAEERKQRMKTAPDQASINQAIKTQSEDSIEIQTRDEGAMAMWQAKSSTYQYKEMLKGRMNLPIAAFKEHILKVLWQNQVFVLSGETGCGKSTQVPSYILEDCLSKGQPCKIYVTEPRRISAISLAERVSAEIGEHRGMVGKGDSLIGSAVRLESNIGKNARLVFATTGIVLRMLEGSRLDGVTHVILDEVHERSIESDFLLIILKSLLEARPDLKVILMSATLDADRISAYFGGCPTVEVPGRTFPVDVRWLEDAVELCDYTIEDGSPYARRLKRGQQEIKGNQAGLQGKEEEMAIEEDDDEEDEEGHANEVSSVSAIKYKAKTISTLDRMDEYAVNHDLIVALLERMCMEDASLMSYSAAILVFLPGIAEIRKLNDMLQVHPFFGSNQFQLFPLHSTISSENQSLVFQLPPRGVRKIVLSTNIAETGITIPDITCVIDTGKHREMRFDEKRQMSKLVECFVAKSNAKQRRGRAGRVQNGLCWHLFTRKRHDQYLAEHPLPEMLRLSLQDLALKLKVMKIKIGTTIEDGLSKALDPPTSINIQRSVSSLMEIKALNSNEDITPLGRHLAKIPLDVHMGKFLLIACSLQILDPALTIAATLNAKSPFMNPFGRELEARLAKKSFDFGDNDFITIVRAFNSWRRATENGIEKQFCQKCFLSQTNLIQIEELREQYLTYLLDSGFVSVDEEERREIVGSRFRYNYTKTKFLKLPGFLNTNSNSLAMINTALVSALYPKLLVIDSKNGNLKTLTNGAPAAIHPSSVNFKMRLYHLPKGINHFVYFTIMQSKRLYAWETASIDDKAILIMCGDADFKFASKSLYIDRIRIRITVYDLKTLICLRILRQKMSKLLTTSYRNPTKPWSQEEESFFLLACRVLGVGVNDKDRALS